MSNRGAVKLCNIMDDASKTIELAKGAAVAPINGLFVPKASVSLDLVDQNLAA